MPHQEHPDSNDERELGVKCGVAQRWRWKAIAVPVTIRTSSATSVP